MTDSISPGKHRLETRTPPRRFVSLALIACVLAAVSILVLSPIGTQQAFAAADGKNNPGYVVNIHPGQATTINLIDYLPKGGDLPPADDEGFSFSVTTAEAPLSANVDPSGLLTLSIPSTATVGGTCSMELSIKSTTESTQHYYIYQFTVRVVHKVDSFNVERDRYALYDGTPQQGYTIAGDALAASYDDGTRQWSSAAYPFSVSYSDGTTTSASKPVLPGQHTAVFTIPNLFTNIDDPNALDVPCAGSFSFDFEIGRGDVTALIEAEKVYDGTNSFVDVSPQELYGVVEGDEVFAVLDLKAEDAAVGSEKRFTGTAARLSGKDADKYTMDPTRVEGWVTITKAPLVFRADNITMKAGEALPRLSYTVEGLAAGDTIAQEPKLSVAAALDTPGSYPIAIEGGAIEAGKSANYTIAYQPGTLIVQAAAPEELPTPPGTNGSGETPDANGTGGATSTTSAKGTEAAKLASTGDGFATATSLIALISVVAFGAIRLSRHRTM